jgi:hypothetical protein
MYLKLSLLAVSYTALQLELETVFQSNAIPKRADFMYHEQFKLIEVSVHDKCADFRVIR